MYQYRTSDVFELNPVFFVLWLAFVAVTIVSLWKVFQKAGKPGWAAIVPIYNIIVLLEIARKPMWWLVIIILAPLIPIVGALAALVFVILIQLSVAQKFGKSKGFGIGLALLGFIFYPILAFGDAKYDGEAEEDSNQEILDTI